MTAKLDNSLGRRFEWQEMVHHVNRLLPEYGFDDHDVLIRRATSSEQEQMLADDNTILATYQPGSRHLEFVVGADPDTGEYEMDGEPQFYAKIQVIETLSQFVEASS